MEDEILKDLIEEVVKLQDSIESLKEIVDLQCSNGNWNYDPYMHGMANGMILSLSLFGYGCNFLDAPKQWLKDIKSFEKPVTEGLP